MVDPTPTPGTLEFKKGVLPSLPTRDELGTEPILSAPGALLLVGLSTVSVCVSDPEIALLRVPSEVDRGGGSAERRVWKRTHRA